MMIDEIKNDHEMMTLSFALSIITLLFEGYLCLGGLSIQFILVSHLVFSVVLGAVVLIYEAVKWNSRWIRLLLLLILFLGPLGSGIHFFAISLYGMYFFSVSNIEELIETYLPVYEVDPVDELYDQIAFRNDSFSPQDRPIAYQDVIAFGTEAQKKMVLERILKRFHPDFSFILIKALNDNTGTIRVFAASVLNKLDDQFFHQMLRLQNILRKNPRDLKTHLALAKHCEGYADANIFDKQRIGLLRSEALKSYLSYLEMNPDDVKIKIRLGKLYVRMGRYNKAIKLMNEVMSRSETIQSKAYICTMNSLYRLREFSQMRELSESLQKQLSEEQIGGFAEELSKLWSVGQRYA